MNPYAAFSLLNTQRQHFISGLLIVVVTLFHYGAPTAFAAGELDASFDFDGIRVITRPGNDRGQAVAIQPADGKIVIAGYTSTFGSDDDVMVVRLDSDGSLDSTFNGGQPRVVIRFGNDRVLAAALQSDGKIVVAGYTDTFGTNDVLVMRFDNNGSLDTTFNVGNIGGIPSGGIQIVNRGGDERAKAIAIQSDGKIVVAGTSTAFGSTDAMIVRLNADGSLDPTFNNGGSQIINRTGEDQICAVVLQGDGKIVVAGYTNRLGSNDVLAARLNVNGGLDTTFNTRIVGGRVTGGTQVINLTGDDRGQAAALQSDGKIVIAGHTDRFGDRDIQVVRLNGDGTVDLTFNPSITPAGPTGGVAVVRQTGNDQGQAVALQTDGKIVVGGFTDRFGLNDFLVMRFSDNGALDPTFDIDGIRAVGPSGENRANALAIQTDQKIVLVGNTDTFDSNDFEVMRFLGQ